VLQRLHYTEGQQVRAGQLLAQIDPRGFDAALNQAKGVQGRDQAQLDNARVDLERFRNLLAQGAVPKQQFTAQQALVRQLEGTLKADQAAVATAQLQLSYTRITAPIAGRAGLKQADLGNVVQPQDVNGLLSITQTQPMALVFSVPAQHVPLMATKLNAGTPMAVQAWAREAKQPLASGVVATLDNAIDPTTDSIKVKALLPNADNTLFPNQAVNVVLELDTLRGALTVPQAAVQRGAKGFYVYVVGEGDVVSMRLVQPGVVDGDWMNVTAIKEKLDPGERVVIDGADRLREGAVVKVVLNESVEAASGASAPGGRGRRGAASGPQAVN
jgi:membrane fusion protein, multidrug efflux system